MVDAFNASDKFSIEQVNGAMGYEIRRARANNNGGSEFNPYTFTYILYMALSYVPNNSKRKVVFSFILKKYSTI